MTDYEEGRKSLESLRDWYKEHASNRNEATTRLHLIDRIFFDVLGWSREEDTILEESQGKEYTDYTLKCPHRMLIVEAKREGDYFELPVGKKKLEYSIKSLSKDFANLKSALTQVASYAQSRGTPFAAVTNGHQVVAFVATRHDGVPPLEGQCLVFPSLDFMVDHFFDLWQHLSRTAVTQHRLLSTLVAGLTANLPPKLSAGISEYPGVKARNVFQTDLQILSELVLEDITRSPELEVDFLESTYCQSGALSQHALTSKKILKSRYEAIFDDHAPGPTLVATDSKGTASSLLGESLSRRPLLLIGDVGVGKTTFIRRLLTIDAKDEMQDAIAIYIDLGSKATLDRDVGQWVVLQIAEQLKDIHNIDIEERNFVHGVYRGDVVGFRNGIYGDLKDSNPQLYREKEVEFLAERIARKDEHLRKSLEHLSAGRKKQIVVFLDNADQRQDIEEQVFLVAHELASRWPATVFVTIRPETFHRSRKSGVLSGYHPKAFTISPPRIEKVIQKRLQFAQKLTSGEIAIPTLSSNMELTHLGMILRSFEVSLRRNEALVECIDNMASGNVRVALDHVKAFFGSGHVDTEKICDICESGDDYIVPVHEFVRSLLFADAKYFTPSASGAMNIFDVGDADVREHFLTPMLLALLRKEAQVSSNAGFVTADAVISQLQESGFSPKQTQLAIRRVFIAGLCETTGRIDPGEDDGHSYSLRVTTKGLYHLLKLARMFTYLDAVTVDLPVFDESVRAKIKDTFAIDARVNRATLVLDYLTAAWTKMDCSTEYFDWTEVATALEEDIELVRKRTQ